MEYEDSARRFKSFILLICYFGLILTLKYLIAAHNFVIIFLVIIVLLLAFEIGINKKSGIKISNKEIICFSGKFTGQIYLSDISCVEFKKRLDFSYRIRLVGQNNHKIALPAEALPRMSIFKEILQLYGLKVIDKKFN